MVIAGGGCEAGGLCDKISAGSSTGWNIISSTASLETFRGCQDRAGMLVLAGVVSLMGIVAGLCAEKDCLLRRTRCAEPKIN